MKISDEKMGVFLSMLGELLRIRNLRVGMETPSKLEILFEECDTDDIVMSAVLNGEVLDFQSKESA